MYFFNFEKYFTSKFGYPAFFYDYYFHYTDNLKNLIEKFYFIPKYRQKLFYKNNSYDKFEEIKDNRQLDFKYFYFDVNENTQEKDKARILVKDCRRKDAKNNIGDFELIFDLYKDLLKQISDYKNIQDSSNIYLIYKNNIFNNYNNELLYYIKKGEKIIIELYEAVGDMEIFLKSNKRKTLKINVDPETHIGFLKLKYREEYRVGPYQEIKFAGVFLEDVKIMKDYNIQNHDTIIINDWDS